METKNTLNKINFSFSKKDAEDTQADKDQSKPVKKNNTTAVSVFSGKKISFDFGNKSASPFDVSILRGVESAPSLLDSTTFTFQTPLTNKSVIKVRDKIENLPVHLKKIMEDKEPLTASKAIDILTFFYSLPENLVTMYRNKIDKIALKHPELLVRTFAYPPEKEIVVTKKRTAKRKEGNDQPDKLLGWDEEVTGKKLRLSFFNKVSPIKKLMIMKILDVNDNLFINYNNDNGKLETKDILSFLTLMSMEYYAKEIYTIQYYKAEEMINGKIFEWIKVFQEKRVLPSGDFMEYGRLLMQALDLIINKENYENEIILVFKREKQSDILNFMNVAAYMGKEIVILFKYWKYNVLLAFGQQIPELHINRIIGTMNKFNDIIEKDEWTEDEISFLCETIDDNHFYKCIDRSNIKKIFNKLKDNSAYTQRLKDLANIIVKPFSLYGLSITYKAVNWLIDKKIATDEKDKETLYLRLFEKIIQDNPSFSKDNFSIKEIPYVYVCNILRNKNNLIERREQAMAILNEYEGSQRNQIAASMLDNNDLFHPGLYYLEKERIDPRLDILMHLPDLPDKDTYIETIIRDGEKSRPYIIRALMLLSDKNKRSSLALECIKRYKGKKVDYSQYLLFLKNEDMVEFLNCKLE